MSAAHCRVDESSVNPEQRCEYSDLFTSQCGHCRNRKAYDEDMKWEQRRREQNAKPRGQSLLGPWFQAAFDGTCSRCDKAFHAFDMIRADWPEGSGYIAQKCCQYKKARKSRGDAA